MKNIRTLKVVVQPIFVTYDDDSMEEVSIEPIAISAKDLPSFMGAGLHQLLEAAKQQILEQQAKQEMMKEAQELISNVELVDEEKEEVSPRE